MRTSVFLLISFTACQAETIQLLSGVSPNEYNNQTGANVVITPHPVWATASGANWISYTNTGLGGTVIPNFTSGTPNASYYQDFYLTGTNNRAVGDITVWADDSASVYLDNTLLIHYNDTLGVNCAAGPIGCTQPNGASLHFDFLGTPGSKHTLRFDVFQEWGDVYGLLYKGSVTLSDPPVVTQNPEPGTFGLVGAALAGAAWFARKRKPSPTAAQTTA